MFKIEKKCLKTIGIFFLILMLGSFIFKSLKKTQMSFIVQYDDSPPINDSLFFKIDVRFRGYDVGDVTKVKLSEDQSHIEFFIDIHYKNLKIPENSLIIFKRKNIYGPRYVDIEPPEKPCGTFIENGYIVKGTEVFQQFDEYLIEELKKGKIRKILDNLYEISEGLKIGLGGKDTKKVLNRSAKDFSVILKNLRIITEEPSFSKDIRFAIKSAPGTLKTVETIDKSINRVNKTISKVTKNIATANILISGTNENLDSINTKVPPIPLSLVKNTEKLVIKTDCFESEISKLLSKRAVFLRLIFGSPGKSFKNCVKKECN